MPNNLYGDELKLAGFHCGSCGWICKLNEPIVFKLEKDLDEPDDPKYYYYHNDEFALWGSADRFPASCLSDLGEQFHSLWISMVEDETLEDLSPECQKLRTRLMSLVKEVRESPMGMWEVTYLNE